MKEEAETLWFKKNRVQSGKLAFVFFKRGNENYKFYLVTKIGLKVFSKLDIMN